MISSLQNHESAQRIKIANINSKYRLKFQNVTPLPTPPDTPEKNKQRNKSYISLSKELQEKVIFQPKFYKTVLALTYTINCSC